MHNDSGNNHIVNSILKVLKSLFVKRGQQPSPAYAKVKSSRPNQNRRSEAGNVFFTLFGAVAVVGVLGAGVMSTMRGPLSTMVEVNRIEEAKAQMRLNARLVLLDAGNNDHCGADDDVMAGGTTEYTEAVGWTPAGGNPAPSDGGLLPSLGGTITDPWGVTYGYCAWDNGRATGCANHLPGQESLNAPAIAIISAGPDRQFQTTCAQAAANNRQGDDLIEVLTYTEAVSGSGGLWAAVDDSTAETDRRLRVTSTDDSEFAGGASFAGGLSGLTVSSPIINTDVIAPIAPGTTVQLAGNGLISGTLTVSPGNTTTLGGEVNIAGLTTINNGLTVSGANPTTLGGTLNVTGAATLDSTLNVGGATTINNTFEVVGANATTLGGTLNVAGVTWLNAGVNVVGDAGVTGIINTAIEYQIDGVRMLSNDDDTSNILLGNVTTSTPGATSDYLNIGDVIHGDLENKRIAIGYPDSFDVDGLTNTLSVNGSAFIDGSLNLNGNLVLSDNTAGRILVADGTSYNSVDMSGDVTISSTGVTTITDNSVTSAKIASNAVGVSELNIGAAATGDCLKVDGGVLFVQACASGGGGDGVGGDGLPEVLINDNSAANNRIINLADPIDDQDAATKIYVDTALGDISSNRIIDAPVAPATEGDTYVDVDVSNDGLTNSIVFVAEGVERMSLSNNPANLLNVNGRTNIRLLSASTAHVLQLLNTTAASAGHGTGLRFSGAASVNMADINAVWNDADNAYLAFLTRGTGSVTEKMRLTASGNLLIGGTAESASALLQLESTTRGFLPPRMTELQRDAIAAPATGLVVFNLDAGDNGLLQFYDGADWVNVGDGAIEIDVASRIEDDDNTTHIEVDTAGDGTANTIVFTSNNAEAMRVTDSGALAVGTATPSASALLELSSTTRGFLPPRMDEDARDAIAAPAVGLMVYNTDVNLLQFWDGLDWVNVGGGAGGEDISSRIEDDNNTTHIEVDTAGDGTANTIVFTSNNAEAMRVSSEGDVGIGTTAPANRLHVVGSVRADTSLILGQRSGDAPNYINPLLSGLGDVDLSSVANGDCLVYNAGIWSTDACGGGGGGGGGAINDLSDAATNYTTNFNMFMGQGAGANIAAGGEYNIAIGQNAAAALTTGDNNIAIGHSALQVTQNNNGSIAIGRRAAVSAVNTGRLLAMGRFAGENYNGDSWQSFFAIGDEAGRYITTGAGITAVGHEALMGFSGNRNTAMGDLAMFTSNGGGGDNNVGIGHLVGGYMAGNRNVLIGREAFKGGFSGFDHRGDDNVYIGEASARDATGHNNHRNTFIGAQTGLSLRNGADNILIGRQTDVTSGTAARQLNIGNSIFGVLDDVSTPAVVETQIGIGVVNAASINASSLLELSSTTRGFLPPRMTAAQRDAIATPATGLMVFNTTAGVLQFYNGASWTTVGGSVWTELSASRIHFGNGGTQQVGIGTNNPSYALHVAGDIAYSGTLHNLSDMRFKTDVEPIDRDMILERLMAVDTYSYRMKDDPQQRISLGVMAQELEKIFPELVNTADDEIGTKSVNYIGLITPLIEASKALKDENLALKTELQDIRTAQAEILEQVHGLSRHTGFNHERTSFDKWLMALMIVMMGVMMVMMIRRRA
ncbi:MAG: tail fiber domain-containing protein [Alphaproteobacteria bacterium]